mmetsp:Transcript_15832/g.28736  ORF Transcript_15832/g.28736 Transcript_15832/m.28736 type:complete len:211 (+) Transcript_15832:218-850(+)|eukprot:CAMPEP_0201866382 /NCGR_PEP_ID=MMETSP0902-20130614/997_1 /ASSEMBLY_ACC=CAM_ASM_000551 /TAXON_ID=420261 /ORGANISM="Thalassiosira antarctica, Strain CCMP982" /LENGTH=210 /DNA_ID=CAMNT_0048391355 /DNA_START=195 /DNA_END=827 /DNA_ORIENTATION=+
MSSPQSFDAECSNAGGDPPVDKEAENGDAATNSSSGGEGPAATPAATSSTPSKKEAATPSGRSEPVPFVYDPKKISLKFIFANRDGVYAVVDCKPTDTVGEVKGALLSMWPEAMPECSGGDKIRLICMGKGMLSPDTKTLDACEVPVFKTHPTPVNVVVRPEIGDMAGKKKGTPKKSNAGTAGGGGASADGAGGAGAAQPGSAGCSCVIL